MPSLGLMLPRAGLPASLVAHLVTPITLRKMFAGRCSPCRPLGPAGTRPNRILINYAGAAPFCARNSAIPNSSTLFCPAASHSWFSSFSARAKRSRLVATALRLLAEIASGAESSRTLCWREMDSNFQYAAQKPWISAAFRALRGIGGALKRYHLMVQPFFCASN